MNLQQLFTMSARSARRFLDRWNAWVEVCDLAPMKRLAKTIMAKSEGILRSIATGLSNGVLEAINGNVQAAKRKAKSYRTKRNLKAIVYLIAGDVLANSPIRTHDILPSNSRLRSSSGIRITRMPANASRSFGVSLTPAMRTLSSSCRMASGCCCRRG